jgi:branched-chain amino acid transport system substrate-binding protein
MRSKTMLFALAPLACVALVAWGGARDAVSSGGPITIGSSLPLTGPLASFAPLIQAGEQYAISQVNESGGLRLGASRTKVKLIVQDNASDPNRAVQDARTLILNDNAVALLGSVSPPLTVPIGDVAESQRVPFVASQTPEEAWLAGNKSGWRYSWDLFFDEAQMTDLQFETARLVPTNKRIALFNDNENDGIAMGSLWASKAPKFGYTIAYHATFPVGTTDYSNFIAQAKASGAQILIAQMIPPDAFALWKQMKSLGYRPQLAFCEKCAAQNAWHQAIGALGSGTSVAGFWTPARGTGSAQLAQHFHGKFSGLDLAQVAAAYTAAKVLLDAIARAGSTNPAKINAAIAQTNRDYPLGHVRFDRHNRYEVPAIEMQWQGSNAVQVYPPMSGEGVRAPVAGLS